MFLTRAEEPLAAPPGRERSPERVHAGITEVDRVPFYRKPINGEDASEARASVLAARKPKFGIALGAGAARGWAHIGVLLELKEHGIDPDIIAGTSIGALVGGAYAVGKIKEMEKFARSLTKRRVMSMMDVSFSGVSFLVGEKVRRELEHGFFDRNFEDLDKKFAAVATETGTGHEVWLTKGSLANAIRASYALPGILEPVQINGRWLFDGALVNPVPVSVCRALGAEIVIAVNLVSDTTYHGTTIHDPMSIDPSFQKYNLGVPPAGGSQSLSSRIFGGVSDNLRRVFGKREDGAPGIASAMMDAFNIAQGRISRSRLAGDPPDVLISTRLGKVGLFDFHRADELIAAGRKATRRAMPEIVEHGLLPPLEVLSPMASAAASE